MGASEFKPVGQSTVIVRITSYDHMRPQGTLMGLGLERPVFFRSLAQLLMTMEILMDRKNRPQRGEEHRAFTRPRPLEGAEAKETEGAALATFQVRVLFRQNASWQGNLVWAERQMDARFRSVLELVRLMDSALSVEESVT